MHLALTPEGVLQFLTNELRNISLVNDPPAYRGGAPEGISLVKFSGDRISYNGDGSFRHEELVLFQFKKDERTRNDESKLWGEATLHLRGPEGDEGGMYPVITFRHDGIQVHVPVTLT